MSEEKHLKRIFCPTCKGVSEIYNGTNELGNMEYVPCTTCRGCGFIISESKESINKTDLISKQAVIDMVRKIAFEVPCGPWDDMLIDKIHSMKKEEEEK